MTGRLISHGISMGTFKTLDVMYPQFFTTMNTQIDTQSLDDVEELSPLARAA